MLFPQGDTLFVGVWTLSLHDALPIAKVQVFLDGTLIGNATLGLSRQDVASYFNRSDWGNSGWSLNYNVGNLAAGSHTITAVAYDSRGATAQLGNNGGNVFTVTGTTA